MNCWNICRVRRISSFDLNHFCVILSIYRLDNISRNAYINENLSHLRVMPEVMNLNQPAAGFEGEICRIDGDKTLKKKLMSLGLRKGQPVSILHQRHKGVVVLSNGSRVALGADIAARVFLQQKADSTTSSSTTEPA